MFLLACLLSLKHIDAILGVFYVNFRGKSMFEIAQGVNACLHILARPKIFSHWSSVRRSIMVLARTCIAVLLASKVLFPSIGPYSLSPLIGVPSLGPPLTLPQNVLSPPSGANLLKQNLLSRSSSGHGWVSTAWACYYAWTAHRPYPAWGHLAPFLLSWGHLDHSWGHGLGILACITLRESMAEALLAGGQGTIKSNKDWIWALTSQD